MPKMRVSVIIPTYNEEENIARILDQLVSQTDIDIIVVDGGSYDDTAKICSGYSVKFISSTLGRGNQLNTGALEAEGDILFFLHADTILGKGIIDDICQKVKQGYKWGCCTLQFDEEKLLYRMIAWTSQLRAALFSSCYGDQGIFCERRLFFDVGMYPDFPFLEDIVLSKKLNRYASAKILPGRVITSTHRFKEGGILFTLLKMQLIKILFILGVPADRLVKIYKPAKRRNYGTGNCSNE